MDQIAVLESSNEELYQFLPKYYFPFFSINFYRNTIFLFFIKNKNAIVESYISIIYE